MGTKVKGAWPFIIWAEMEFAMSAEMEDVQKVYGSSHGYQMNRELALPDVR